ncbi:CubicO group peptidase, beta-lactamase class C family [Hymenobacter gelipurpurascens]|uniref:CubicO group peptidase, beta-lactamase class C family n=1 Tax=Hymenobacter gelipurpurascens TaxID=89968 RepID=A0A212U8W9_9BACT|nr:serine hydrolase domain-containing protein [Hymenobacter gelipurpurascens]SNC74666.1 CubicO group peptidase, beta-lactamase class C family [Hymenobacter gelipurpurascens]
MKTTYAIFLLVLSLGQSAAWGQTQKTVTFQTLDGRKLRSPEIDRLVQQLMDTAHIPGLALALLQNNKVQYLRTYGYRNLETRAPLEPATVMYGASFSKAVFGYLVMQLVQEKRLDLDKPLYHYLSKPIPEYEAYHDLVGDDRWRLLTARMALTHTTGLPNWRWIEPDKKLRFKFAPGAQYWYSGEGLQLLQLVVETVMNKSLTELSDERIFKPLQMSRTSYVWQPAFEGNYALGYDEQEQMLGIRKRTKPGAAGSLNTTPADYATFLAAVMQGRGLTPAAKQEMTRAQVRIPYKAQFGPLATMAAPDSNRAKQLAYGLGWGTFEAPKYGHAYFKEGHDDGWENHSVIFGDQKKGLLLMSNSSNADLIFKELLEKLLGDTATPWQWEGYEPYASKKN